MKKQIQKRIFAVILAIVFFTTNSNAQVDPVLAAQLQQIVNKRVQTYGDKGVSSCVIMPNGDTWKGTAGVGQGSVAITDSTVFHGASITKANIATLMLLLAEDGLVNLDSSWHKYINLNVNFNTAITLRQLLSHTSGIADYLEVQGSGTLVTSNFNQAFTPVYILENIVSGVPDFAPGTNFKYSTSNYVLAALIAQTVTGHPVQQELHTRIWSPLGMTHTYFGGFESYSEQRAGVWWDFESGMQDYSNSPETSMLTYGYGGANIVSTPGDLALFARALFTGTLLSQASMNQMKVFNPNSYAFWAGYGLGVHHPTAVGSTSVLGHDGYYTNMSDMFHNFEYGFTLVTMTNSQTQLYSFYNQMSNAIKKYITTVGIKENSASLPISLFPNPATDNLSITLGSPRKNVELTITDVSGKIIYASTTSETQTLDVNTKNFAAGIYLVQIGTQDFRETKKLVITK